MTKRGLYDVIVTKYYVTQATPGHLTSTGFYDVIVNNYYVTQVAQGHVTSTGLFTLKSRGSSLRRNFSSVHTSQ